MKTIIILLGIIFFLSCSNIKRLERQADKGDIEACYSIVELYSSPADYSTIDKRAQSKVVKYSKKALAIKIDTNNSDKKSYYGLFYISLAKADITNMAEKYFYFKKAAECDDKESQWITGLFYLEGRGGKINNDSALYWIKQASIGNNYYYSAIADNELGNIFIEGKIVKEDTMAAMYYYKKSCACYRQYSNLSACEKVIKFYKVQKNLKDTSELAIYSELARKLRQQNGVK